MTNVSGATKCGSNCGPAVTPLSSPSKSNPVSEMMESKKGVYHYQSHNEFGIFDEEDFEENGSSRSLTPSATVRRRGGRISSTGSMESSNDSLVMLDNKSDSSRCSTRRKKKAILNQLIRNMADKTDSDTQPSVVQYRMMVCIMAVAGIALLSGCLYMTLEAYQNARTSTGGELERASMEWVGNIQSNIQQYRLYAAWIHQTIHATSTAYTNRNQLRQLYTYINDTAKLDIPAIAYIPAVRTPQQRKRMERDSEHYVFSYSDNITYRGFLGLESEPPPKQSTILVQSRSPQVYYFPIHYLHPLLTLNNNDTLSLLDLDLYSIPQYRNAIHAVYQTHQPVLITSNGLFNQQHQPTANLLLLHPAPSNTNTTALSMIILPISSLLSTTSTTNNKNIYIYEDNDTTPFIAAINVNNTQEPIAKHQLQQQTQNNPHFIYYQQSIPAISLSHFKHTNATNTNNHNNQWTIIITSPRNNTAADTTTITFTTRPSFLLLPIIGCSSFIFTTTVFGILLYVSHRNYQQRIRQLHVHTEAEKAIISSLFPTNVLNRLIEDHYQNNNNNSGVFGPPTNATNTHAGILDQPATVPKPRMSNNQNHNTDSNTKHTPTNNDNNTTASTATATATATTEVIDTSSSQPRQQASASPSKSFKQDNTIHYISQLPKSLATLPEESFNYLSKSLPKSLPKPSLPTPPLPKALPRFSIHNTNNHENRHPNNHNAMDSHGVRTSETIFGSKPIADFIPEATVMFADMVGFTAWSSVREPTQVFTLLETIYHSFDTVAKQVGVFKLETVGDCYVAVTGVPQPRKDHAVVMCKFATDCLFKMKNLTRSLEVVLGPDTADLQIRVGIHSGPVTAGVLRGDNCRFQLFGDTMNTASRMESNSSPSRIQVSKETAELLIDAGKGLWLMQRTDKIHAKGKGELQTYWLDILREDTITNSDADSIAGESLSSSNLECEETAASTTTKLDEKLDKETLNISSSHHKKEDDSGGCGDAKIERLIKWNVDVMQLILQKIVARNAAIALLKKPTASPSSSGRRVDKRVEMLAKSRSKVRMPLANDNTNDASIFQSFRRPNGKKKSVISELKDIIVLPSFDATLSRANNQLESVSIELDSEVLSQLASFVHDIAYMYNNKNPFHNFERASHVSMSVSKLLSRIVNPKNDIADGIRRASIDHTTSEYDHGGGDDDDEGNQKLASGLHDHTYGIWSDPLTQFACVFAAIIQDVDHPGVPNTTLVQEESELAKTYNNESVAEQNSFTVAWDLLMQDKYEDFRECLLGNSQQDYLHFRQLVINLIMASDIKNEELGEWRKERWDLAFSDEYDEMMDKDGLHSSTHSTSSISSSTKALLYFHKKADYLNRRATIVIELIVQASDVAHAMQHWHVFVRWNERLFHEMYHAYMTGRIQIDPSLRWYEEVKEFFDDYVLPLANKLFTCGVFGVSSDEYFNYAKSNQNEWESRGQEMLQKFIKKYEEKYEKNYQ